MPRYYIVPGLAKAGTTFLFDQLAENPEIFNLPRFKEINYFQRSNTNGLEGYLRNFITHDIDKIYIDASPVYINTGERVVENIFGIVDPAEVFSTILIRDPVSAVFSHYLHDLKSHHGRLTSLRPRPSTFSLKSSDVLDKYLRAKFDTIAAFHDILGARCIVLPMKDLFNGAAKKRIESLMSIKLKDFDAKKVSNSGGFVPQYYYGGDSGTWFTQDGSEYFVPRDALVSGANERSEIIYDVDSDSAESILALSESFTYEAEFRIEEFDSIIRDHERICAKFSIDCPIKQEGKIVHFAAQPGKVSLEILQKLERR